LLARWQVRTRRCTKYLEAVDEWRDQLRRLKELELEVGNVVRDREIL
jgi:hypothetical protein